MFIDLAPIHRAVQVTNGCVFKTGQAQTKRKLFQPAHPDDEVFTRQFFSLIIRRFSFEIERPRQQFKPLPHQISSLKLKGSLASTPLSRFILTFTYSSSPRIFVVDWLSVKELNQRRTYNTRTQSAYDTKIFFFFIFWLIAVLKIRINRPQRLASFLVHFFVHCKYDLAAKKCSHKRAAKMIILHSCGVGNCEDASATIMKRGKIQSKGRTYCVSRAPNDVSYKNNTHIPSISINYFPKDVAVWPKWTRFDRCHQPYAPCRLRRRLLLTHTTSQIRGR